MVGDLTPSSSLTQEYAKADPIYVEKTMVSATSPTLIIPPSSSLLLVVIMAFAYSFPPSPCGSSIHCPPIPAPGLPCVSSLFLPPPHNWDELRCRDEHGDEL